MRYGALTNSATRARWEPFNIYFVPKMSNSSMLSKRQYLYIFYKFLLLRPANWQSNHCGNKLHPKILIKLLLNTEYFQLIFCVY